MQPYLESLNDPQRQAVLHTEGPLLIAAGAGAGKTKTITTRIVHLIHQGVAPHEILAITFTNKAASEMRDRVLRALEHERRDTVPLLTTFHSLGVRILREHADKIGRSKTFAILDESDTVSLIKESLAEAGYDPKQYDAKKIRHTISREKGNFVNLEKYRDSVSNYMEEVIADVWTRYERKLASEHGFDFDDLLLHTVLLLKKYPDVRDAYHKRYRYLHVDEYQDTNEVQYEMTKLLVGKERNICVVGDTDQNIYGWRGARLKNMLHFEKDFPNATILFLEQNYRSTKTILKAANTVIAKNTVRVDKTLFTENEVGEPIGIFEAYDEGDEARFVADRANMLIKGGISPDHIAVLYRANFQSRVLEEYFLNENVPYQVLGTKFFDRREIKDMLSYLRAARNPEGLSDIKRIINLPARGIGKTTIAKLFAGQKADLPKSMQEKIASFYRTLEEIKTASEQQFPSEVIKYILQRSGLEASLKAGGSEELERLENIQELVSLATKYDALPIPEGIEKLLDDAALATDQDSLSENKNGVRLMTVHAAKGLEFAYVFITGLEQDLFPHKRGENQSIEDKEEERRLFYVALTRAEEKLYLSYTNIRTLFGNRQVNTPSEFLFDLPGELTEQERRVHSGGGVRTIYLD